jgi:hypothetical protein
LIECFVFLLRLAVVRAFLGDIRAVSQRYSTTSSKHWWAPVSPSLPSNFLYQPQPALLAIDLGLRSGFAFYSAAGRLLEFACERFPSTAELPPFIRDFLASYENKYQISHIILEGDAILSKIWTDTVHEYSSQSEVYVIGVSPQEWRDALLTRKERQSGKHAKTAAREISRQIMWRSGLIDSYYNKPMNTDAAEAILIGYYSVKVKLAGLHGLGFSQEGPEASAAAAAAVSVQPSSNQLIERYCNGNVVLPPREKARK